MIPIHQTGLMLWFKRLAVCLARKMLVITLMQLQTFALSADYLCLSQCHIAQSVEAL